MNVRLAAEAAWAMGPAASQEPPTQGDSPALSGHSEAPSQQKSHAAGQPEPPVA